MSEEVAYQIVKEVKVKDSLSKEGGRAREKKIFELKRLVKESIDENNYLKALPSKEKKPTSRFHLKLELFEVNKLANRLAETVTENEMGLEHLKSVNKHSMPGCAGREGGGGLIF